MSLRWPGGLRSLAMLLALCVTQTVVAEETINFGRFGTISIYKNSDQPKHVVLFVSGDDGWVLGVKDMARALADKDSLVAGIDVAYYLKQLSKSQDKCSYPAGEFENLSHFLQKKYGFKHYVLPVLVGYSSGATLVYATQVQGPPNTFRGAMSLGFCPDLPLDKPFCQGLGDLQSEALANGKGIAFLPAKNLLTPWVVLHGAVDQVCAASVVEKFISQTPNASVVDLPNVGHGFSVPNNWMPSFLQTFEQLVGSHDDVAINNSTALSGLPVIEEQVSGVNDTLAVIVSGDGGWASIDRGLAIALNAKGISVVGLDSLQYFWSARTADEMGKDMGRMISHYVSAWGKKKVLLIGYSRGADVVPFMVTHLPENVAAQISFIALLGAEHSINFEFRITDWLPGASAPAQYQVVAEVKKLAGRNLMCLYGSDESDTICPELDQKVFKVVKMEGGHHFGGDYQKLAETILSEAP